MSSELDLRPVSGWRLGWRLSRYLPARYYLGGLLWVIVVAFPVLTGLVLKALFDRFSEGTAASLSQIAWLLLLFVVLDVIRQGIMWVAIAVWPYWWNSVQTLLRANVLRSILCAPGPAAGRLPASSAEALNRFRDDVEEIVLLTDIWVDLCGDAVFASPCPHDHVQHRRTCHARRRHSVGGDHRCYAAVVRSHQGRSLHRQERGR